MTVEHVDVKGSIKLAFQRAYDTHADFEDLRGMINLAGGHDFITKLSFRHTAIKVDKKGGRTTDHFAMFDLGMPEFIPLPQEKLLKIQKALSTMGHVNLGLSPHEKKVYAHIKNEVTLALESLGANHTLAMARQCSLQISVATRQNVVA
jgi:hypothetical protein